MVHPGSSSMSCPALCHSPPRAKALISAVQHSSLRAFSELLGALEVTVEMPKSLDAIRSCRSIV